MKALEVALDVIALSCALASLIFMGIVFFSESILGHGITFVEPNRAIASAELALTIYGFVMCFILWVRRTGKVE